MDLYKKVASGMFKCYQCEFKCATSSDLKKHYQDLHRSEDPDKCFQCGYEGASSEDLKQHAITHFDLKSYKCGACNFTANEKQYIINHMKKHHELTCICSNEFQSSLEMMDHLNESFECKNFFNIDELEAIEDIPSIAIKQSTSDTEDADQVYVCQICFYIFRTDFELKEHKHKFHLNNFPAPAKKWCNSCSFNTTSDEELVKHQADHKFFLCSECHYIFSSHEALNKHLATHNKSDYKDTDFITEEPSDDVEYICFICDKSFSTEKTVKSHMSHHALVKFKCPRCNIIKKSHDALKSHLSTHTNKCDTCGKVLKTLAALKSHMNSHIIESVQCPLCPYKTKYACDLRKHFKRLSHLSSPCEDIDEDNGQDEIIVECPVCQKQFDSKEELRQHAFDEHVDPAEKLRKKTVYKCGICPYETLYHDYLQRHLRKHNRDPSKRKIKPTFKVKFGKMFS